jgi:signal peptidase I
MAAATTRRRRSTLGGTLELLLTVAAAVGLALLVRRFVVKPYRIPSISMEPTLIVGQRVLVSRFSTHPGVGDVVVFHPPAGSSLTPHAQCGDPDQGPGRAAPCDRPTSRPSDQTYIKRVVGLPGDRLTIRDGAVYRNGMRESGSYVGPCPVAVCTFQAIITVPPGDYYMMGDNRGRSDDSRFWGPVPQSWIIGTAFATYWPLDRIGVL